MKRRVFTASILMLVLSLCSIGFAASQDVFTGGYRASDAATLKYVISGATTTYADNIIKPAAYSWNFISSKVSVTYNSTGAKMSVFLSNTAQAGLLGVQIPYYTVLGINYRASNSDIWDLTDVYGYENQMNSFSMTDTQKNQILYMKLDTL